MACLVRGSADESAVANGQSGDAVTADRHSKRAVSGDACATNGAKQLGFELSGGKFTRAAVWPAILSQPCADDLRGAATGHAGVDFAKVQC